MSSYSGPQGKGASKLRKKQKREEAVKRQAEEKTRDDKRNLSMAKDAGWASYEEYEAHDFLPRNHYQEFEDTGITVLHFAEVEDMSAVHDLLYQIFGK